MAGGTIPRGFGLALGRSRSVTTTGWLRWSERNGGGGGVARRTPTSIRNSEGGTFYFDTEVSPDGFEGVNDLIDVVIAGPTRVGHLYVTLADFVDYGDDYTVRYLANTWLGVVPIRGSARGAAFPVLVGGITSPATFGVGTPSSEGTVNVTLWVPEVG